jgi:hypothetical protein
VHLIAAVILRYHPEWVPPADNGRRWIQTLCPFHGDTVPSAAISYEYDAFRCLACEAGGTAIGMIKNEEGGTYAEAVRIAEEIIAGSNGAIPRRTPRQPRRRVSWDEGFDSEVDTSGSGEVPAGLRGRANPWT